MSVTTKKLLPALFNTAACATTSLETLRAGLYAGIFFMSGAPGAATLMAASLYPLWKLGQFNAALTIHSLRQLRQKDDIPYDKYRHMVFPLVRGLAPSAITGVALALSMQFIPPDLAAKFEEAKARAQQNTPSASAPTP